MFLTASEIATAKLPGLPAMSNGVKRRANRELWPWRPRLGRGGGREYPLSALPEEAQAALLAREAGQSFSDSTRVGMRGGASPSLLAVHTPAGVEQATAEAHESRKRPGIDSRLSLLQRIKAFAVAAQLPITKAERLYMDQARAGGHPQDVHIYRCGPGGSIPATRTVRWWREEVERGGPLALKRNITPTLPPMWAEPLLKIYARPTKPSLKWCVDQLRSDPGADGPELRTGNALCSWSRGHRPQPREDGAAQTQRTAGIRHPQL